MRHKNSKEKNKDMFLVTQKIKFVEALNYVFPDLSCDTWRRLEICPAQKLFVPF